MFLNEAADLQHARDGETFTWGIILYVSGSKLEKWASWYLDSGCLYIDKYISVSYHLTAKRCILLVCYFPEATQFF